MSRSSKEYSSTQTGLPHFTTAAERIPKKHKKQTHILSFIRLSLYSHKQLNLNPHEK